MPPKGKKGQKAEAKAAAVPVRWERPPSLLRPSVAARFPLPQDPSSLDLQKYIVDKLGTVPMAKFGDVDDRDIPDMVAMTIKALLDNWEDVPNKPGNGYGSRLEENINLLRDDKLKLYAGLAMVAKRDVEFSQSRVNVWRRVFEERYGLSGDPESSSEAFLSHGVEKLIPDDIDNINRYMRFRALFLILYKDAVVRDSDALRDEAKNIEIAPGQKKSLVDLIAELAPPEDDDDDNTSLQPDKDDPTIFRKIKLAGGGMLFAGGNGRGRGRGRGMLFPVPSIRAMRVGGAKKTTLTEKQAEKLQADLEDYKQKFRFNIPSCSDPKSTVTTEQCLKRERDFLLQEYREQVDAREAAEERLAALRDRRKALLNTQRWLTASWQNLEVLPTAEVAVQNLQNILLESQTTMVGREEIMNRLASMIHTFSYNHRAFTQTYLNFALLGMPGTGKTTIAQTIANIFRNMGILVTSKFSTVGREDMVGQYLGETALKTKGLLINHIEGVVFLDEAYSLGASDSSGKPDVYGAEALNTLTNFTDKWRGQLVFIAAGYEDDMNKDFFGVNKGLERRFTRLPLDKFSPEQLLIIFLQKVLKKIRKESDRKIFTNPNTLRYTLSALALLNNRCVGTRKIVACLLPNQGGDVETLADIAVQYFYNVVKPRQDTDFSPCDMRNILQRFLFQTQRAHIVIDNAGTQKCDESVVITGSKPVDSKTKIAKGKRRVPSITKTQCDASGRGCLRLTNPNTQLIAALKFGTFETNAAAAAAAASAVAEEVPRNTSHPRPGSRPSSRRGGTWFHVPIPHPGFYRILRTHR
jgi:hypothetical protein